MNSWRQAFHLAKLELRQSLKYILSLVLFVFVSIAVTSTTEFYLENNIVIDVWFILSISFVPFWILPKEIQYQKVNENGLWATPLTMMQLPLPIPKDVLVKSRFVIYFLRAFPLQLFLIILIYLVSDTSEAMLSFGTFICFAIIWLSFYIALGLPIGDVGAQLGILKITFTFIGLIVGLIGLLMFFHFRLGFGIVYGSILLVQKWPLLSTGIALAIAIMSVQFYQWYMKRQIGKLDYFC